MHRDCERRLASRYASSTPIPDGFLNTLHSLTFVIIEGKLVQVINMHPLSHGGLIATE